MWQAAGNVSETELRRIQIREAVKAHLDKEKLLFLRGIKVLTLFFIDEVKKYRMYADNQDATGLQGEYAAMFEEEYAKAVGERLGDMLIDSELRKYWTGIAAADTHAGYFAEDKKHRLVDSKEKEGGSEDDRDAYDLNALRELWTVFAPSLLAAVPGAAVLLLCKMVLAGRVNDFLLCAVCGIVYAVSYLAVSWQFLIGRAKKELWKRRVTLRVRKILN